MEKELFLMLINDMYAKQYKNQSYKSKNTNRLNKTDLLFFENGLNLVKKYPYRIFKHSKSRDYNRINELIKHFDKINISINHVQDFVNLIPIFKNNLNKKFLIGGTWNSRVYIDYEYLFYILPNIKIVTDVNAYTYFDNKNSTSNIEVNFESLDDYIDSLDKHKFIILTMHMQKTCFYNKCAHCLDMKATNRSKTKIDDIFYQYVDFVKYLRKMGIKNKIIFQLNTLAISPNNLRFIMNNYHLLKENNINSTFYVYLNKTIYNVLNEYPNNNYDNLTFNMGLEFLDDRLLQFINKGTNLDEFFYYYSQIYKKQIYTNILTIKPFYYDDILKQNYIKYNKILKILTRNYSKGVYVNGVNLIILFGNEIKFNYNVLPNLNNELIYKEFNYYNHIIKQLFYNFKHSYWDKIEGILS